MRMAHEEGSELDRALVEGVPDDRQIELQVRDALAWEDGLDPRGIRIAVCGGLVVLTGQVRTAEEKELAESVVWGIRGVTDVSNELEVAGDSC